MDRDRFLELVHPDDRAGLENQAVAALAAPAEVQEVEFRLPVGGEVRWLASRAVVVPGLDGQPAGRLGVTWDVTARKRMEEALRERDEVLTLAEQSAGIGVWDQDLATGMVRATPQFFHTLGVEPAGEPVPVACFRAFRHPEDGERVVEGFQRALQSGAERYEVEYRIVRGDGEIRWIFGRGRIVRDPQARPVRYSGIDIDVTERKRLEERQKLLLLELSHRVKNTLAVVRGSRTAASRTAAA
jgi:PAS domain S-box-containing protein